MMLDMLSMAFPIRWSRALFSVVSMRSKLRTMGTWAIYALWPLCIGELRFSISAISQPQTIEYSTYLSIKLKVHLLNKQISFGQPCRTIGEKNHEYRHYGRIWLTWNSSTTCDKATRQNCFKKEHLAICEHPDCCPKQGWPGRAFQTALGCTIHPYRDGWNLNYQPGYTGPRDYVRPPVTPATPVVVAAPPKSKPKRTTKRLKRWFLRHFIAR